jgi:HSP20 family molecular chaperone IbpA
MKVEMAKYEPDEIDVRITKTLIKITGKRKEGSLNIEFYKEFSTPPGVKPNNIQSLLSEEGVLTLVAPIEREWIKK